MGDAQTPKYSPEALQRMAREALAARDAGDPRWLQLVFGLVIERNWPVAYVERTIERLAVGHG